MPTSAMEIHKPLTHADLIDGAIVHNTVLVACYVAFIGSFAQISFRPLFTSVPMTGQTFAVLLGAANPGLARVVAEPELYANAGVAGLPWFAGVSGWWHIAVGPDFGYLISFILVAVIVGLLAKREFDRSFFGSAAITAWGSPVISLLVDRSLDSQLMFWHPRRLHLT